MSIEALRQIESLLPALSREEKVHLVGQLAHQLQDELSGQPPAARGRWKGKFPENVDLDQALKEIRHEWEEEISWMKGAEPGKGRGNE